MTRYVRMADPAGGWYDDEMGFKIVGAEIKELPEPVSRKTQEKIRSGGLIECEGPERAASQRDTPEADAPPVPDPEPDPAKPDEPDRETWIAERIETLEGDLTVAQLKDELKTRGVDPPKRARQRELAELLATAEWQSMEG